MEKILRPPSRAYPSPMCVISQSPAWSSCMRSQSAGRLTLLALYFPRHFVASSDFTLNKNNKKPSRRVSLNYFRIVGSHVSVRWNRWRYETRFVAHTSICETVSVGLQAILTERRVQHRSAALTPRVLGMMHNCTELATSFFQREGCQWKVPPVATICEAFWAGQSWPIQYNNTPTKYNRRIHLYFGSFEIFRKSTLAVYITVVRVPSTGYFVKSKYYVL